MKTFNVGGNDVCKSLEGMEQDKFRVDPVTGAVTVAVEIDGVTVELPGDLNVQLHHDGTNPDSVLAYDAPTTHTIYNVAATLAATEYSQALPANTKRFMIRARGKSRVQLSFTSGQSGTNFITIPPGANYEDPHRYSALTLYFQTSKAGETVEIIAYT